MPTPHAVNRGSPLRRLLRSLKVEVLCDECFERLDELVELELAGVDAADRLSGVRAHLDRCGACREEYESLGALLQADADAERG